MLRETRTCGWLLMVTLVVICESPLRHDDYGHTLELARTLSGGPR
jgi:hypothetical protein